MDDASSSSADTTTPASWPRSFRLHIPTNATPYNPAQFSQTLFRGPGNRQVRLLYSDNFVTSEAIARLFLKETIVGFDMEWIYPTPPWPTLQQRVSLIQVASEDKVALFHIGRHAGNTPTQLIAPSLRELIESPDIRMTGQSIMVDCARLKQYFGLQPRTVSELSYLHILVTDHPDSNMTMRYVRGGLQFLVQDYFPGLTLVKDNTTHGNWTSPLTERQLDYAAADAYASLMVWHIMNATRLNMQPRPPLPRNIDEYLEMVGRGWPPEYFIELEPLVPGAINMTARDFFLIHESLGEDETLAIDLDSTAEQLYQSLAQAREAAARRMGVPPRYVAADSALRVMAKMRPQTERECRQLPSLGIRKHGIFAGIWVDAILRFMEDEARGVEKDEDQPQDGARNENEHDTEQRLD
ncbi:ribonuclease H-like protein [Trematosphaeria pertusa]|uniref:Ribonuclease H-like protein n=1 Tax=Trematosphaeria pertusa TaxID=390896 RepID=A0A6A6J7N4_9PLEO|nr:ribonuclease H-like protein [Trematosphaeria pertusa]KAF2257463.1 ribonuclease H-like protein [Trematosphaeria pertusa]